MPSRLPTPARWSRAQRRAVAAAVAATVAVAGVVSVAVAAPFGGDDSASNRPGQAASSSEGATASSSAPPSSAPPSSESPSSAAPPEVDLPKPVRGERALELLGDELPEAAQLNGMEPEELRELLAEDPTAWLDESGRVFFIDTGYDEAPVEGSATGLSETSSDAATVELAATDAFALHSKPGARRTIFLDVDGATVSSTAWNSQLGVASGTHPGWDPAGDGASFSAGEASQVRSLWARVAEDFAPFDVDVTTEDPGDAAITRSGSTDQVFGTRVLISSSRQASDAICGSQCGGVAYLNVFAVPDQHAAYQPAWVFPHTLGNDTKSVAEAATHEAGHNLGLEHDGTATSGYYSGHGLWAPIMGSGYRRPLVQWSRGRYLGADNQQDDLAQIAAGGAPLRVDEAGATVQTAAATLPAGRAYVSTPGDRDTYALGTCRGDVVAAATPATISPNLDVAVELLSSSGAVVLAANPLATSSTRDLVTGLGATAVATLPEDTYYVRVTGVGQGDPITGYENYGSLGPYALQVTGCGVQPAEVPTPTESASPTPTSPTTSATPSPSPSATSSPSATTDSPTTSPTPTNEPTPEPTPQRPSAPAITRARGGGIGAPVTARVDWQPPTTATPPVAYYRLRGERVDTAGRVLTTRTWTLQVPQTRTSATVELPRKGRWRFLVQAGNDVGLGPWSSRSPAVRAR